MMVDVIGSYLNIWVSMLVAVIDIKERTTIKKRIFIIYLGDSFLLTAVWRVIRRGNPKATITTISFPKVFARVILPKSSTTNLFAI